MDGSLTLFIIGFVLVSQQILVLAFSYHILSLKCHLISTNFSRSQLKQTQFMDGPFDSLRYWRFALLFFDQFRVEIAKIDLGGGGLIWPGVKTTHIQTLENRTIPTLVLHSLVVHALPDTLYQTQSFASLCNTMTKVFKLGPKIKEE